MLKLLAIIVESIFQAIAICLELMVIGLDYVVDRLMQSVVGKSPHNNRRFHR